MPAWLPSERTERIREGSMQILGGAEVDAPLGPVLLGAVRELARGSSFHEMADGRGEPAHALLPTVDGRRAVLEHVMGLVESVLEVRARGERELEVHGLGDALVDGRVDPDGPL